MRESEEDIEHENLDIHDVSATDQEEAGSPLEPRLTSTKGGAVKDNSAAKQRGTGQKRNEKPGDEKAKTKDEVEEEEIEEPLAELPSLIPPPMVWHAGAWMTSGGDSLLIFCGGFTSMGEGDGEQNERKDSKEFDDSSEILHNGHAGVGSDAGKQTDGAELAVEAVASPPSMLHVEQRSGSHSRSLTQAKGNRRRQSSRSKGCWTLLDDPDLWIFDLHTAKWSKKPTTGPSPMPRAFHTLTRVSPEDAPPVYALFGGRTVPPFSVDVHIRRHK